MRTTIAELIEAIEPCDILEQAHIADALAWIASGSPLCRIAKPDVPPKHLVSYFLVVDPDRRRLLLVDHRNAGLWLPNGGHVEPDEHPADTVRREIVEELALEARFLREEPIFLTVTETVGATAGHVDVSLWYAVQGDSTVLPWYDQDECSEVRWFAFDDLPLGRADPHLGRFVAKLSAVLDGREETNDLGPLRR